MTDYVDYTASIHFDRRLYRQDIAGSTAHARMLARQGIIPQQDADQILQGLETIRREIEEGSFAWDASLEDLHMNIESRLAQLIGPAAGRLHTGRSRNDQIALDMRLFTKEVIRDTSKSLRGMQQALVDLAEQYQDVVMPGYTHLQRAQPVLFAHHLLAYFQMLQRDLDRFRDCYRRTDVLPLGSGALAGVPYPTDREFLARELGFREISANSMDAVADRGLRPGVPGGGLHLYDAPVPAGGGDSPLVQHGVRVRPAVRLFCHRQQHHAPEAQPRLRRAGPWQDGPGLWRPGGVADGAEGPASDL